MATTIYEQDPVERVVERLRERGMHPRGGDGRYESNCPAHDDRSPSLSIGLGRDKDRVLVHCHAGCEPAAIADALGLQLRDLFAPNGSNGHRPDPIPLQRFEPPTIVASWDYYDEDGTLVARVVRQEPKTFRQYAIVDGVQQPRLGDVQMPLYRLPQIRAAIAEGLVPVVVEGEHDADTLVERLGMPATTSPGGAGKWRSWHTEQLRGATSVLIVADDDPPGHRHARDVCEQLIAAGIGVEAILRPQAGYKDVTEHLDAGLTLAELRLLDRQEPVDAEPEPEPERTSWWPVDLRAVLSGDNVEPDPTELARTDGRRLLYPGKVNGIIGASESGKTWMALLAVRQALVERRNVLYLDFEDTPAGIVERLQLLGVGIEVLDHLRYVGPDETLGKDQRADLDATLVDFEPDLIVVDGFNAAMTLLGLKISDNDDATVFAQRVLKPLAATGAAVLYVDHVPKTDTGTAGGIGAQAKRAMTTGAAYRVKVVEPFGRGQTGRLELAIDKDRPGRVRAYAHGAKNLGTVIINSHDDGVTVTIEPPAEQRDPFRPTGIMVKVSEWLDGREANKNAIAEAVPHKRVHVFAAIDALVAEGYLDVKHGARNSLNYRSIKRFEDK